MVGLLRNKRSLLLVAALLSTAAAPGAGASEAPLQPVSLSTPQQVESAFLQGLRHLEQRRPREAVVLFRQILAHDPNLPRVRLELARAYFLMQSWSESRTEFVAVLSGDVPTAVKQNILRFINAIDARRGFDWDAAFGLSLNPDANRKYKTDTVKLDFFGTTLPFEVEREDNEAFGLYFDGSAEIRHKLLSSGAAPAVVGFVAGSAALFEADGSQSDDRTFGARAGSRFIWPRTTAIVAVNGSLRHRSGEVYEDRIGVSSAVEFRSETGFSPLLSASYADVTAHARGAADGGLYGLGAGFSKSVLGSANLAAFAQFQRFDAERIYDGYDALDLSVIGRADIGAGFGATGRVSLRYSDYRSKTPFFLDTREDLLFGVSLEMIKNDVFLLGQFSPFIEVGYTHNGSSIGIYTYNEVNVIFGLKNAF